VAEPAIDAEGLLARARTAWSGAYAPYSGMRVGAALLDGSGRVWLGANVENAAFGASICAERVALPQAVTAGVREFVALAVAGEGEGPCTPCGACRQVLHEFAPDLVVIVADPSGRPQRLVLGRDLLPYAFGHRALPGRGAPGA
jgi:cytidine deaminase